MTFAYFSIFYLLYAQKYNDDFAVNFLLLFFCGYTQTFFSNMQSRKLKSRYGARNWFQEPSLELSSQAT